MYKSKKHPFYWWNMGRSGFVTPLRAHSIARKVYKIETKVSQNMKEDKISVGVCFVTFFSKTYNLARKCHFPPFLKSKMVAV